MAPKCEQNKKKKNSSADVFMQSNSVRQQTIILTNTEKLKETWKNRKWGQKIATGQNRNWTKIIQKLLYYTVTKGYHYAYPDWECEKGKYSSHAVQKKKKKKENCNHKLHENKKYLEKEQECNQLTRVKAKIWRETEMSSTKETWLHNTNHIREKKKDFFS